MRREEAHHIVIVKGQSRAAEFLGIRRKIKLPANNSCFQLSRPISAVAVALQNPFEIGEKENVGCGICRDLLFEPEVSSFLAELPSL